MHLSVYLPFLFSGLFGLCAPGLARRLPPTVGTWLLSVGGLFAAAGSAAALALLGFTLIGHSPQLEAAGRTPRCGTQIPSPRRSRPSPSRCWPCWPYASPPPECAA